MKRHVTANEVYEFVKEAYPTIGKGTVYRNLDILVEEGALRKKITILFIICVIIHNQYICLASPYIRNLPARQIKILIGTGYFIDSKVL